MKFIPATLHGFLDYAVAATLVAGPVLLGFQGPALMLAAAGGIGLFLYSLITDYSTSVQKILPFWLHLVIDFVAALVLIAAPYLFGFTGIEKLFYLVIGISVAAVVIVTNTDTRQAEAPA
ncbi:MAG: hypothetical protein AAGJ29_03615 [Pseudomonadota bacterium]